MSLVTMLGHYDVPMQTLSLLFSVGSASSVTPGGRSDGPVVCDFSSPRSDICELKGDVRVLLPNATILHFHPSAKPRSWRMKPLARKHDPHALARVTEVTIIASSPHPRTNHSAPPPAPCTATHAAPAVVFSAGGYAGNMFHVLTDVLVPLFATARRLAGDDDDVHLLVRDAQPWWLDRYGPLLRGLSRHAVVDVDVDRSSGSSGGAAVLCFPRVVVGLDFHKEMSVDAARTMPGGYTMADFAGIVRRSYGLPRDTATRLHGNNTGDDGPRPRLLIISRKSTRTFTNIDAITSTATALGFDPIVAEPERYASLAAFARVVNSCDVMVGVHGAGLANLVFLPAGGVVVQVVPLGGLDAVAAEDFGAPARDAGLRYVHYAVGVEESSLATRYPRDHRVLRDPAAVRREGGWMALRAAYLVGQNVTVDVRRFSGALRAAMELLP
ncbi:hypothetical protein PR202_ga23675 [Eleusine coracana subsp. coracana]|uniref:Glycosyltransferase 61 catalytic domain-containing protein n=1 Tax=Eleusine coracana subsp. coracana TaxID=191504 RepID=A0AAV5D6Z9_ELECO|nr:hypothetical protein PR202_ga23675 [Eleusine coracana subsp. coracana]